MSNLILKHIKKDVQKELTNLARRDPNPISVILTFHPNSEHPLQKTLFKELVPNDAIHCLRRELGLVALERELNR